MYMRAQHILSLSIANDIQSVYDKVFSTHVCIIVYVIYRRARHIILLSITDGCNLGQCITEHCLHVCTILYIAEYYERQTGSIL